MRAMVQRSRRVGRRRGWVGPVRGGRQRGDPDGGTPDRAGPVRDQLSVGRVAGRGPGGRCGVAGGGAAGGSGRIRPDRMGHWGWAAEVTGTVPAEMSAFSLSISAFSSAGTLLSKSWYGAIDTPLLASVPT